MKVEFTKVQYVRWKSRESYESYMVFEGSVTAPMNELLLLVKNPADAISQRLLDDIKLEARRVRFEIGNIVHTNMQQLAITSDSHRWIFEIRINGVDHQEVDTDGKPFSAVGNMQRPDAEWNI